jgi:hypothetical protein
MDWNNKQQDKHDEKVTKVYKKEKTEYDVNSASRNSSRNSSRS